MGWNNTFTYKNWDLTAFFTGVFGQKIFNEPRAYFSNIGSVTEGKNVMKSVIKEQRATDASSALPSDRYLEDGSYFRLSNLTIGYTFRNFNGWLRGLRLYARATMYSRLPVTAVVTLKFNSAVRLQV